MKNIILLKEQGFCSGVTNAITKAIEASKQFQNIYLLGSIVHNKHIDTLMNELNIKVLNNDTRLNMLNNIPNNSTVIFTAHGVSDKVREIAIGKNLNIIDATCPFVNKSIQDMKEYLSKGYDIFFIGKNNHPEVETALSLSNKVHIVDTTNPIINKLDNNLIVVTSQTTMSKYDILPIYNKVKEINPNSILLDSVCHVTTKRQDEITNLYNDTNIKGKTIIIIIGDITSTNSTKLYELTKKLNKYDSIFIEDSKDIDLNYLKDYDNIVLSSGTSTPIEVINNIYSKLKEAFMN